MDSAYPYFRFNKDKSFLMRDLAYVYRPALIAVVALFAIGIGFEIDFLIACDFFLHAIASSTQSS